MTGSYPAWLAAAGGALAALLALGTVGLLLRRRRRKLSLDQGLRRIAWAQLRNVIIPDDVDGEIHLDVVVLTGRSIVVLEVRRGAGTLFWGDQLEQWTLLDGAHRTVLRNPLPGLQARRHAVQAIAPHVPVDGCVLLLGSVQISGGVPPGVLQLEQLLEAFPPRGKQPPDPALRQAWDALRAASRPA